MKIYEQQKIAYADGSERIIYRSDPIKGCSELKGFLLSVRNNFGKPKDIIVKKHLNAREVLVYGRYTDLYDFLDSYSPEDIREYNIYEFICQNMHCKLDILKNIFDVYSSEYSDKPESNNYSYYKFNSGLIIRFNNDNGHCCYRDNYNRWIKDCSLQRFIYDAAYSYEVIDEPLTESSAEEAAKAFMIRKSRLEEMYMTFCTELEIVQKDI